MTSSKTTGPPHRPWVQKVAICHRLDDFMVKLVCPGKLVLFCDRTHSLRQLYNFSKHNLLTQLHVHLDAHLSKSDLLTTSTERKALGAVCTTE
jgi:hypothetical protein